MVPNLRNLQGLKVSYATCSLNGPRNSDSILLGSDDDSYLAPDAGGIDSDDADSSGEGALSYSYSCEVSR